MIKGSGESEAKRTEAAHKRRLLQGKKAKLGSESFSEAYGNGKAQSFSSVPRYDLILN